MKSNELHYNRALGRNWKTKGRPQVSAQAWKPRYEENPGQRDRHGLSKSPKSLEPALYHRRSDDGCRQIASINVQKGC